MIKITISQPNLNNIVIEIPYNTGVYVQPIVDVVLPPPVNVVSIPEPIVEIVEPVVLPFLLPPVEESVSKGDIDNTEVEWHSQQIPAPISDPPPSPVENLQELPLSISVENTILSEPVNLNGILEFVLADLPYDHNRTKANVISTINQLNKHFGWQSTLLHYSKIEADPTAIKDYVLGKYVIGNTSTLRTKLLSIVGAMSRCVPDTITKLSVVANTVERTENIQVLPDTRNFPNWIEDALPALDVIIASNNKTCSTIASVFKEGYVFRISVLFNTMVGPNLGQSNINYLDLDTKIWHLCKIKASKPVNIPVTDALIDSIKQYCTNGAIGGHWWLIDVPLLKDRINPTLGAYGWDSYTNNQLRHSFETWNVNTPGRSIEEQMHYHTILGHKRETALQYYCPLPQATI